MTYRQETVPVSAWGTDRDFDALQQRTPKMVVVASYRADYQALLERRLIDLAIVPRFDAHPEPARNVGAGKGS